jgi:hypothetical protein
MTTYPRPFLKGGYAMQAQQQFHWFPGQALALILALFAAALLGGGAGYQLRDHGFLAWSGTTTKAPATHPAYARPAYLEPDAVDRSVSPKGPAIPAPIHGLLP